MKVLMILGVVGCAAPAGPHVISGTVEQNSFVRPVDQVAVMQGATSVVRAPITGGTFSVTIPAGTGYRLELTSSADRNALVSPRATGVVTSTFTVRGGGTPFDVGMVRAIAPGTSFVYGPPSADCQDGKDSNGNVCVDDQQAEQCGDSSDSSDGADGADGADGDTGNDQAPSTQAVADHNIPSSIGCEGGGDSGGDHQNEGEEQGDH